MKLPGVKLTSCDRPLDGFPEAFGAFRESNHLLSDVNELREEVRREGYLFLRNFVDLEKVAQARKELVETLSNQGVLDERHPPMDAVASPGAGKKVLSVQGLRSIHDLVRSPAIMEMFSGVMDGKARALDHVWGRIMGPGSSTPPHCDIVYMGRGTKNLYTCWIPLGDVPLIHGPLMILERSHTIESLRNGYCQMDIDLHDNWKKLRFRHFGFFRGGHYTKKPAAAQKEFRRRWLSADFRAGDIIIFSAFSLHGTLDNRTRNIRLSVDARYQLADDPADERWIGANPPGHHK